MKTIVISTLLLILVIMANKVYAQDEFYNPKETKEISQVKTDSVDISSYSTADDYYFIESDKNDNSVEQMNVSEDKREDTSDDSRKENRRKRERNERGEFISNLVVDVFINTVFIIATCWH